MKLFALFQFPASVVSGSSKEPSVSSESWTCPVARLQLTGASDQLCSAWGLRSGLRASAPVSAEGADYGANCTFKDGRSPAPQQAPLQYGFDIALPKRGGLSPSPEPACTSATAQPPEYGGNSTTRLLIQIPTPQTLPGPRRALMRGTQPPILRGSPDTSSSQGSSRDSSPRALSHPNLSVLPAETTDAVEKREKVPAVPVLSL